MENKIRHLIDSMRPIMQRSGGDILFSGYDPDLNSLRLIYRRADYHCPGANGAMQMLFEKKIRSEFPNIIEISFSEEP